MNKLGILAAFIFSFLLVGTAKAADLSVNPASINLKSEGKVITAYIEPTGYVASDINVSTVRISDINGTAVNIAANVKPTELGDNDLDGVQDLMVKFDRQVVNPYLSTGTSTITVGFDFSDGSSDQGVGTVKVVNPGKGPKVK